MSLFGRGVIYSARLNRIAKVGVHRSLSSRTSNAAKKVVTRANTAAKAQLDPNLKKETPDEAKRWQDQVETDLNREARGFFEDSTYKMGGRTHTSTIDPTSEQFLIEAPLLITSVNRPSFVVGNKRYDGPIFIIGNNVLSWDVPQYGLGTSPDVPEIKQFICDIEEKQKLKTPVINEENKKSEKVDDLNSIFVGWSKDMFVPLEYITPRPEILVVGTGSITQSLPPVLLNYVMDLGIQIEVQNSRSAAATYNYLVADERIVACAILPEIPTSARTGLSLVDVYATPKNETI